MSEQILCISYFDQIIGPNTFYCSEDISNNYDTPNIGRILEFQDVVGSFIFAFRKYQTINHIFYINSKYARGGKELIMITYMIKSAYFKNEIVDVFKYLESKKPILEKYASELSNLKELPLILNTSKSPINRENPLNLGTDKFKKLFTELFNYYFKKLSLTYKILPKTNLKKIFIFGSRKVGKTTLLKHIEAIQFYNQNNDDLPTQIYEIIIDNIEILTYDCIKRDFICEKCENYGHCSNAQGFILLLNLSDKSSLTETKNMLYNLINRCKEFENYVTPVLIIGNKFKNQEEFDTDFIFENLSIKYIEECNIKFKYFPINISKEDDKIMNALRWLVRQMV
ncbi:MAG: ADP-ribosylation factor-like protein [Promethearchaeota archaeon]